MPASEHPSLILPGEFTDPSGLVRVRPSVTPLRPGEEAALWSLGAPADVVAVMQPPSFFDQVYVYATHQELHPFLFDPEIARLVPFPEKRTEDVVELIRTLPFEPAMRFAAGLQRMLRFGFVSSEWQRLLALEVYGTSEVAKACERFLRARDRAAIFSEQQLFALQRLLVLHASDEHAADLTQEQHAALRLALYYAPGTVLQDEVDERAPNRVSDAYWLRHFVSLGSFAAAGNMRHDIARAHRLYEVIAKSSQARRDVNFCPIDAWLEETYGFSFLELQALGIALLAGSKIVQEGEMPLAVKRDYFASASFSDRVDGGLTALVADRDWYRTEFQRSPEDPRRAAYEIQPFLRRPGLTQADGSVIALAPRAISSWLSATGTYYRLFDVARLKGSETRKRFTRFNGFLEEMYASLIVHAAHPHQHTRRRLRTAGCVYGEITYKKGKQVFKTSDVIIDLGRDLVLIEVTAKRLTVKSVVEADAESVQKDIKMMILDKMKQLGRVTRDIFEDPSRVPVLDLSHVERIWPIVVSSEGIFHSPSVWGYTLDQGGAFLSFTREEVPASVQPHILLDLEELELLMGIVEEGHSLIELLERKISKRLWLERDMKTLLSDEWTHRWSGSPSLTNEELRRAISPLIRMYRAGGSSGAAEQQRAA